MASGPSSGPGCPTPPTQSGVHRMRCTSSCGSTSASPSAARVRFCGSARYQRPDLRWDARGAGPTHALPSMAFTREAADLEASVELVGYRPLGDRFIVLRWLLPMPAGGAPRPRGSVLPPRAAAQPGSSQYSRHMEGPRTDGWGLRVPSERPMASAKRATNSGRSAIRSRSV